MTQFNPDIDRVLFALRHDKAFLTMEDRAWIADMLESNTKYPIIKDGWMAYWHEVWLQKNEDLANSKFEMFNKEIG